MNLYLHNKECIHKNNKNVYIIKKKEEKLKKYVNNIPLVCCSGLYDLQYVATVYVCSAWLLLLPRKAAMRKYLKLALGVKWVAIVSIVSKYLAEISDEEGEKRNRNFCFFFLWQNPMQIF